MGRARGFFGGMLAMGFALGITTSAALAQPSRPMDRTTSGGDPLDRGATRVEDYRGGGGGGHAYDDFPRAEVHDAVDANARTAFARAQYHRLQDSLNSTMRQMQYNFEHSGEMADALKTEQQAWEDYVAARNAAIKAVVNDPKYQSSVAMKNEVGDRIAEAKAEYAAMPTPSGKHAVAAANKVMMKELVTLAMVKLDYAQVATDMEVTAIRGDSKVADTRKRLMESGARVQALRADFDLKVRNSPELASLRSKIDDARVAFITAESYRNGAVEAANEALDYAYYKNRLSGAYNNYGYPYGYPYAGYGYGVQVRY